MDSEQTPSPSVSSESILTPIARSRVFVLLDGSFVVRWSETRVQELETGQYRPYRKRDFGAWITDYELGQLKAAGLVDKFDRDTVWLSSSPERRANEQLTTWEKNRTRSYYLNTVLPGSQLPQVQGALERLGLNERFQARVRDDFVVIWAHHGISFHKFDDAEEARQLLVSRDMEVFEHTVVAFIETTRKP